MKRLFLLPLFLLSLSLQAQTQVNQACFLDSVIVDYSVFKKDTTYLIRDEFRKGDWELYYDFGLTKKKAEMHYTDNGEKIGTWHEWYKNGTMKSEFMYDNPVYKYLPLGKSWFSDGKLNSERFVRNDSIIENIFFKTGKLHHRYSYEKAGSMVKMEEWCENGQLIYNYNPTAVSSEHVLKYHCNGKVKTDCNWFRFGYTGAFIEYHDNGQTSTKGQFETLPPNNPTFMPRKTGTWQYYNEKGKLTREEQYDRGRLVKTTKF